MSDPAPADRPLPPGIAAPARRALAGVGIVRLEQLREMTEIEVAALHGMGPQALRALRDALAEAGWAFRAVSRTEDASPFDAYLAGFEGEARAALDELLALLRAAVPGATETMSYGIPTLDLDGKHVVHFAGYPRHVGLYPTPSGMTAFDAELARYVRGKGSVRFPLGEPLPADLVRRIAAFRVAEVAAARRAAKGGTKGAAARRAAPTKAPAAPRERHPMSDAVRDALEAAGLTDAYAARPPFQRNDYLGWIAGAKRDDTRARRLRQMLDELAEGDVYMRMPWRAGDP